MNRGFEHVQATSCLFSTANSGVTTKGYRDGVDKVALEVAILQAGIPDPSQPQTLVMRQCRTHQLPLPVRNEFAHEPKPIDKKNDEADSRPEGRTMTRGE